MTGRGQTLKNKNKAEKTREKSVMGGRNCQISRRKIAVMKVSSPKVSHIVS